MAKAKTQRRGKTPPGKTQGPQKKKARQKQGTYRHVAVDLYRAGDPSHSDGGWFAAIPEHPGAFGEGATAPQALRRLAEALEDDGLKV